MMLKTKIIYQFAAKILLLVLVIELAGGQNIYALSPESFSKPIVKTDVSEALVRFYVEHRLKLIADKKISTSNY